MPRTPLESARRRVGKSQAEVAKAIGVTQPTYQRYEKRKTPVPDARIKGIMEVLNCTMLEASCRSPITYGIADVVGEHNSYYGEAVVYLTNNEHPFVLPVSLYEANSIGSRLRNGNKIIAIHSLDNRVFICNKKFVADIVISDDSADYYGPEEPCDPTHGTGNYSTEEFWDYIYLLAQMIDFGAADFLRFNDDEIDFEAMCNAAVEIGLDLRIHFDFSDNKEINDAVDKVYSSLPIEWSEKESLYERMMDLSRYVIYKVAGREVRKLHAEPTSVSIVYDNILEDTSSDEGDDYFTGNWIHLKSYPQPITHIVSVDSLEYMILPLSQIRLSDEDEI